MTRLLIKANKSGGQVYSGWSTLSGRKGRERNAFAVE